MSRVSPRASGERGAAEPTEPRAGHVVAAVAGPLLIVIVVLWALRDMAFRGRVSPADPAQLWLPIYCYLGRSLAGGHIPAWDPHVLGGMPFAADPQSGWMYAPAMLLFSTLSCGAAVRWMIVAQPILAGLGVFAFLRAERASRVAATVGGVTLAAVVAGTQLAVSLPFSGTLAWTALTLAAAARFFRSSGWPGRLGWLAVTALAWGQLAAAHFSVGLAMGSLGLAAYAVAKALNLRRNAEWGWRAALLAIVAMPAALFLVNLAFLLPRLGFAPRTSLAMGYGALSRLSLRLTGEASPPFPGYSVGPGWPLQFSAIPGVYLGALPLAMSFASFGSRTRRHLAWAFGAYGAIAYLPGLRVVATRVPPSIRSNTVVDFYLHNPYWVSFSLLLAVAVLAGLGLDAWWRERSSRRRLVMVAPALVIWAVAPLATGHASRLWLLGAGTAVAAALLGLAVRRSALAAAGTSPARAGIASLALAAVPVALAVEVLVGGTVAARGGAAPFQPGPRLLVPLGRTTALASSYLRPGPLAEAIRTGGGGRYVTIGSPSGERWADWRSLQNNQSLLFGLDNVGGYDATQVARYWEFVRTVQRSPMKYSYAVFTHPSAVAMNLLAVRWTVVRGTLSPGPGLSPAVASDHGWTLYEDRAPPPMASVFTMWTPVSGFHSSVQAVSAPAFDPSRTLVVEGATERPAPGGAAGSRGTARYVAAGPQRAIVEVDAPAPALVLVRNIWDPGWHATVDGKVASVLPADAIDQAVPVPAGRHTIVLSYGDQLIGYGLAGSALSLLALGVAAGIAARRAGRPSRDGSSSTGSAPASASEGSG